MTTEIRTCPNCGKGLVSCPASSAGTSIDGDRFLYCPHECGGCGLSVSIETYRPPANPLFIATSDDPTGSRTLNDFLSAACIEAGLVLSVDASGFHFTPAARVLARGEVLFLGTNSATIQLDGNATDDRGFRIGRRVEIREVADENH